MMRRKKGGKQMMEQMKRLVNDESGQGMAEYGLILALVAVVVIVALGLLGYWYSESSSK
jgi:pilus assembly protein Flp/PilA